MLSGWSNFFTMTGAAGATLVGLLFVVVTVGTGLPTSRTLDIARASMTPALYSFSGVLLQSMVALVPWQSNWPSGVIFVVMGIGGVIFFNHWTYEGWALRLLGATALDADPRQLAMAEDHLRQALARGEKLGMRPLAARCHADLARLCSRSGRGTEASQHLRTATMNYREMGMAYWLGQLEAELIAA